MNLNDSQRKAVQHLSGPMLVVAGPGSGKTAVITYRVLYLIKEYKIPPAQILTVTFSRAAAEEMSVRFRNLYSANHSFPELYPKFGTFHSVFYQILRTYNSSGCPAIISDTQKFRLLKTELSCLSHGDGEPDTLLQLLLRETSIAKNSGTDLTRYIPKTVPEDLFHSFFLEYNRILSENNVMDFDDILLRTFQIFMEDPSYLQIWQKQFPYIQIDEFQDINDLQYEIIKLLAAPAYHLAAVGDDDQSIYGFRGTNAQIMQRFLNDFNTCKQVILSDNYRSPCQILIPAQRLIQANHNRIGKEMTSRRNRKDASFHVHAYQDPETQYRQMSRQILLYRNQGRKWGETAILVRQQQTIPYLLSIMEQYHIPYDREDHASLLYTHFICQDLIAYMKTALQQADRSDLLRIINRPFRSISRHAVPEHCDEDLWSCITNYYNASSEMKEKIRILSEQMLMIAKLSPFAAIMYIYRVIGYDSFLHEYASEKKLSIVMMNQIVNNLLDYSRSFTSLQQFLDSLENPGARSPGNHETTDFVHIMTIHAAKGLEFPIVFIPDLNQGILPGNRSNGEETEEERRLLYVAMTRASCHLHISYSLTIRGKSAARSVFLDEINGHSNEKNSPQKKHS